MRNSETNFMRPLAPLVLPAVYDDVLSYEEWLSKVVQRLNEINEYIDQTIGDIETLVDSKVTARLADIQSQVDRLKTDVQILQGQLDCLDGKIDESCADTLREAKQYTDNAIARLGDIDGKIAAVKAELEAEIEAETYEAKQTAISESKNYTNQRISLLTVRIEQRVFRQIAAVEERINNIIKEYPLLYNPATGWKEDMQTVVYNLYKALRYMGITAMLYDDQELTAEQYDDMSLTASAYDTEMYHKVFKDLREMFNPFTGKLSSLRDVVGDLVRRMQWNAKTASEADGYQATASEFDASTFDAYEQDTNQYITATTPDVKNKSYRNWLYVGSGNSVTVPDVMIDGSSQFAILNSDGDITYIDTEAGTYGSITISYADNVYTITGTNIRCYVVTRVFDVTELDK